VTDNLPATTGDSRMSLGQTHLDASDLILPRIKVVQQMSAEANDERAKAGEFFDTLRGRALGTELRFIPLLPFKQRVFLVRDQKRVAAAIALEAAGLPTLSEGDGLKCRSLNMFQGIGEPGILCNECPLSKWTDGNTPPLCSETYNVAAMSELGEMMILSFSKSSAKTGKRLFSMLRMSGIDALPWARIYEAKTRKEKNDQGTFFVPDVTDTGEATPTELLAQARKWATVLEGAPIDVTPEGEEEEAGAASAF
jgi:hypothetical protein